MCILLKRTPRRADTNTFYFMGHADSTAFYFALNVLLMRQIYHDKPTDRGFRLPRPSRVASYTKEYEAGITRLWPFLFDFCQLVSKSSHYTFPRSLIIQNAPCSDLEVQKCFRACLDWKAVHISDCQRQSLREKMESLGTFEGDGQHEDNDLDEHGNARFGLWKRMLVLIKQGQRYTEKPFYTNLKWELLGQNETWRLSGREWDVLRWG